MSDNSLVGKENPLDFMTSFGTRDKDVNNFLLGSVLKSSGAVNGSGSDFNVVASKIHLLGDVRSSDPLEAALKIQMVSAFEEAMNSISRAKTASLPEVQDRWTRLSIKLMNCYSGMMETLCKYQGRKTEHKVVVEKVTVAPGGKAIVGNVQHGDTYEKN